MTTCQSETAARTTAFSRIQRRGAPSCICMQSPHRKHSGIPGTTRCCSSACRTRTAARSAAMHRQPQCQRQSVHAHLDEVWIRVPRRGEAVIVMVDEKSTDRKSHHSSSRALRFHQCSNVVQMQKSGQATGAAPGDDERLRFGDVRVLEQMAERLVQIE